MNTFNIYTFLIGIVTIVVNVYIAIYNVGKNRKIYEIDQIFSNDKEAVNKKLRSDDYTILYVGAGEREKEKIYLLGKLTERKIMNNKQLVVLWVMAILICYVWIDWAISYLDPAKNLTAALIATHIVTMVVGGLLIYTLRDKKK